MDTIAFIVLRRDGMPFLVRRGEYYGYPCVKQNPGDTIHSMVTRALSDEIYPYYYGRVDVTTVPNHDQPETFSFDGKPIIAKFLALTHYGCVSLSQSEGSYDLDHNSIKPDVFVQFFEDLRNPKKRQLATCAA